MTAESVLVVKVRDLAGRGLSAKGIAVLVGLSADAVLRACLHHGIALADGSSKGKGTYAPRLTGQGRVDAARGIHRCRDAGMTRPQICVELGITMAQLDAILADYPFMPAPLPIGSEATAECPVCDLELPVRSGRLDYHGPCDGSGLPLAVLP